MLSKRLDKDKEPTKHCKHAQQTLKQKVYFILCEYKATLIKSPKKIVKAALMTLLQNPGNIKILCTYEQRSKAYLSQRDITGGWNKGLNNYVSTKAA